MNTRVKSAIATAIIQGGMFYALIVGLAYTFERQAPEKLAVVDFPPEIKPPPPPLPAPPIKPNIAFTNPVQLPVPGKPDAGWATAGALQRNLAFTEIQKWRDENMSAEERRTINWRAELPQGSGPGRVTRVRPANLTTHTLYWPAKWSRGRLPIIAWGNGQNGMCGNSSLPYAGFLSEIASYGYFVVAVGNDDIDYPQPEGLEILADGRPVRTQPSALNKAIDWAIAENSRGGSPYAGRLDTSKIAYMGHSCGGVQAMLAASDPRTTTIVLLNAPARFRPDPSAARKPAVAHFEGARDDDTVIEAGDANFARAQTAGWPMFKAALNGMGHAGAYPAPDRRWSRAVLAWLNWQLKGDSRAAATLGSLARSGWSRIDATGIALAGVTPPETPAVKEPEATPAAAE